MSNKSRLEEIEQEIKSLEKEAEQLKEQYELETLEKNWLVQKIKSLGFRMKWQELSCYETGVYYITFANSSYSNVVVNFYGNRNLSKLYFYEVYSDSYSVKNIFSLKEVLEVKEQVEEIVTNIEKVREIMHKNFNSIDDASDDFDSYFDDWYEKNLKIIESEE